MKIKVLGSEAACGTSSTNGSNFSTSTHVRVVNSGSTDEVFAAHAEVLGVGIAVEQ